MKKVLIIFIRLFFCTSIVNAIDYCTPSQEYLDYMKLPEEERSKYIAPNYCSEIKNSNKDDNQIRVLSYLNRYIGASTTDERYKSTYVTSIKNQNPLGTCWSFSSIAAVESNAKKNGLGDLDLSEQHMIYSLLSAAYSDSAGKEGKYYVENLNGGKTTYAASYFFNGYGQLTETEWKYDNTGTPIKSSDYKKGRNILSVGTFRMGNFSDYGVCSSDEINYIKDQIIKHGSVQGSMYMQENLFDSTANYYKSTTSNSQFPNHGISIIGWDDTISKSKFKNAATRDGAFIIKNSWGSSWSNDGLFYISYDDNFICKDVTSFYDVSDTSYDNSYKSSDMVGIPTFSFKNTFYITTGFRKQGSTDKEVIKRISFATAQNSSYVVYISFDPDITNRSKWSRVSSGTTDFLGIKSIDTNIEVEQDFGIIIQYNSSSYTSFFTMCDSVDDTSKMYYGNSNDWYSNNGLDWSTFNSITIGSEDIACEPNIFVYTDDVIVDDGESVTSNDSSTVTINKYNILVSISNNYTLTYNDLISKLNIVADSYSFYDNNNNVLDSSINPTIPTNYKIKLTNKLYNIIVMGDVNSDGKISALDYIEVRKHIMGTKIKDSGRLLSADMDKNNTISALDYIAIRKILMR